MAHENGWVIDNGVVHAVGKILLQLLHGVPNAGGELEGISARHLKNGNGNSGLVIEERTEGVAGGAELDAGNVFEQSLFAVRTGLDDNLAKLLGGDQPAFGIDLQFEIHWPSHWLLADSASSDLDVLLADGIDDVAGGEISG